MKKSKNSLPEHAICKLLGVIKKGIPDCYDTFEDYVFDFWFDLSWDEEGHIRDVKVILADKRFTDIIVPGIKKKFNFDMKKELEEGLILMDWA